MLRTLSTLRDLFESKSFANRYERTISCHFLHDSYDCNCTEIRSTSAVYVYQKCATMYVRFQFCNVTLISLYTVHRLESCNCVIIQFVPRVPYTSSSLKNNLSIGRNFSFTENEVNPTFLQASVNQYWITF